MAHEDAYAKMAEILDLAKIEGSYLPVQGFSESSKVVDLSDLAVHFALLPVTHDSQVVVPGNVLRYVAFLLRSTLEQVVV